MSSPRSLKTIRIFFSIEEELRKDKTDKDTVVVDNIVAWEDINGLTKAKQRLEFRSQRQAKECDLAVKNVLSNSASFVEGEKVVHDIALSFYNISLRSCH